jgi:hypothetical protein
VIFHYAIWGNVPLDVLLFVAVKPLRQYREIRPPDTLENEFEEEAFMMHE